MKYSLNFLQGIVSFISRTSDILRNAPYAKKPVIKRPHNNLPALMIARGHPDHFPPKNAHRPDGAWCLSRIPTLCTFVCVIYHVLLLIYFALPTSVEYTL